MNAIFNEHFLLSKVHKYFISDHAKEWNWGYTMQISALRYQARHALLN